MTGRRLALELSRKKLGNLEGRNDVFELSAATKARFAGVAPGTREAECLALNVRVWFDLNTGAWESGSMGSRVVHSDAAAGMLQRIMGAANAVTAAIDQRGTSLHPG